MRSQEILSTGLPLLDDLLGGGIPRRQSVIITGDPGSGKTILCSQIAFARAAAGSNVVLATITSEPHDKLVEELRGFTFFDADKLGNEIFLLSAYASLVKGPEEAKEVLLRTIRERKASLLFVDGLRSLRDLWQDESAIRKFLYDLSVGLAQADCTALLTTEYPLATLLQYPEATTVDAILSLSLKSVEGRRLRRLEVAKLRGRAHVEGEHVLHIDREGVQIVRRLETLVPARPSYKLGQGKVDFGLPELDRLLGGGLPLQTTTLLAGSTGVGKTLLSLHFAAAGAAKGEPVLFISYAEPAHKLMERARQIGLDVSELVAKGALTIVHIAPVEIEADDLAASLLSEVDRVSARRLVLDGVSELEGSLTVPQRGRRFLTALVESLRARGVTSVFIKEVPKIAGVELDFSDTPLAVTAENLLFLRYFELRGRLHRIISILKVREGAADNALREFVIDEGGMKVLGPIESAEGLLTGLGRPVATRMEG
ncbi:MAG TPA: ATPase domain-containing protein [Polyangia bacterium]|nr:ATPase domain-containing protein [Polyangia bacterium]